MSDEMDIVVFGNRGFASLVWHCLKFDSPHRVVGFTVDAHFLSGTHLHELPVVAFDKLERHFAPSGVGIVFAMGGADNSRARSAKLAEARTRGYPPVSWTAARAAVAGNVEAGQHCLVFDGATVQAFTAIGDNVVIRNGCHVSHHVAIGDNCFLAPAVVVCGGARIGNDCTLGANCTVLDGVTIAPGCTIGAGAIVNRDLTEPGTYVGTPARLVRRAG